MSWLFSYVEKITHMWRRWGQTSEFPFGIYWWTLKKPEKLEFWKNEKKILLEISSFYTCVSKATIIWSTVPEKKKWKKHLEMSSYQTCATKNMIICCMLTQIWNVTDIIFCSFSPLLTPKIWKKCKKHLEILSFYTCAP